MSEEKPLRTPKFIITSNRPLTPEQMERFQKAWNAAVEAGGPVVLDNTFQVFAVNGDGQWTLLNASAVIP